MTDLDGRHRVQALVARPAVYVHPDDTLRQVAETLNEESIGAVLVRAPDGNAEGLVSERDVVRALAEGGDADQVRAVDVMADELLTVGRGDEVASAVSLMLDAGIRHLPVVDDGVHYGVVSARDALRALLEEHDEHARG